MSSRAIPPVRFDFAVYGYARVGVLQCTLIRGSPIRRREHRGDSLVLLMLGNRRFVFQIDGRLPSDAQIQERGRRGTPVRTLVVLLADSKSAEREARRSPRH